MIKSICEKIIEKIMDKNKIDDNILFDMEIWDWSQGVALYGIWKYYEHTKEERYLEYLKNWFDNKMDLPQIRNVNTMAPLLTLCHLYEETAIEKYKEFCDEWAEWVLKEMPKTQMGGIQHYTIDSLNEEQLWADTVFMTVLFLIKCGSICHKEAYIQEGLKQFLLHIRYLSNNKHGLWAHGWSFLRGDNFASAFWARGNCWFTIAAAELPQLISGYDWLVNMILDAYRQQVDTCAKLQSANGLWHTLLDDPDSYVEVSGSAGITYGILKGIRMGHIDARYSSNAKRAAAAIIENIDSNGMVQNVSYGTIVADNLDYYKQVKLRPTGYGQNIALILLVELLHHPEQVHLQVKYVN